MYLQKIKKKNFLVENCNPSTPLNCHSIFKAHSLNFEGYKITQTFTGSFYFDQAASIQDELLQIERYKITKTSSYPLFF
mgnify:CR=1 FL=1